MSSAHDTGRAGEFLASYILETFAVEVHHVSRDGADLWCKINDSRFVTIDVKTASEPKDTSRRSGRYRFWTPQKTAKVDYYGFVALDKQLLILTPTANVTTGTTSIAQSNFNEGNQRRTIEEMIAAC